MRALALPPFLRLLLRWWWLCAWALGSVAAQAATYSNASIPFNWINPATHTKVGYNTAPYKFNGGNGCATTPPTLDDAISDQIPIGFNFTYGSTVYTQVQVMTNGRLQFNNSTCGFGTSGLGPPQTYPYLYPDGAMNNTMKVFGVDLDPTNLVDVPNYPASNNKTSCTSSAACFVSVATVGTAPNRKFVVTWYHVPEWVSAANSSGSFDVQVILNENGSFVYQYGTIVHGGTGTAQIGWQLTTGDYQVLTFGASAEPPANSAIVFFIPASVLAWYQMEEGGWATGTSGQVRDSSGSGLGGTALGAAQPVAGGKVCRGVNIPLDTTAAGVNAVQLGTSFAAGGAQTLAGVGTLMFWIKTNTAWSGAGVTTAQLVDATTVNGEWFTLTRQTDGSLVFLVTDSTGAQYSVNTGAQAIAAGTWVHVTVWWNFNGNPGSNQDSLAISLNAGNPVTSTFTSDGSLPNSLGNLVVGDNALGIAGPSGSVNSADAVIDEVQVFNSLLSQGQQTAQMNATYTCDDFSFHHLELRHGSWSGVACSPATLTVVACADSSFPCTNPYTKGVSLTLGSSGITTTWMPGGDTSVNIGYGQSSATKLFYAATGTGTLQVNSSNITPSIAARCNGSANSCSWTSTSSGLLVGAPALTGGQPTSLTVRAVESVGASTPQSCVAIQNLTSSGLRLWATSVLPGSSFAATSTSAGVTVGGAPLVGSSSSTTSTRLGTSAPGSDTLSGLAFDGNASTTVWLQHMDVGRFTLQARLVTTMPPLTLNGSASIDAQPLGLGVAVPAAWAAASSAQTACAGGSGSGCDSAAGAAAKVGAAGSGFASSITAALWTVAGDTDLSDNPVAPSFSGTATLSPSLLAPQGGSAGGLGVGSITLSTGTTGSFTQTLTQSGAFKITASSSWLGSAVSGTSTLIGRVVPRYFKTTLTTAGCGSFTYAGQPMAAVKVQAMDGAGTAAATGNYSGAFARSVTLSDGSGAAGSFSANTLVAAAFSGSAGATGAPVYSFTTKLTAPATLALRASDGEVTSAGVSGAEAAALVRSGRLRLSNAFGRSGSTLAVPLTLEYWGGSSWVTNSADNCTSVPAAAVALSNPRDSTGAATATGTSVSALSLANGQGTLTLAAPSPAGRTLSLDLAINLGSSGSDQSCATNHPSTSGAGLAWLRSSFGNCAGSTDRDPAARASFGIYSPESRKTVHARDVF